MVRTYKSILGAKVLEFDSGNLLGFVTGILIDPDTGMVEAFWVKALNLPLGKVILRSVDILELKKHLYVTSEKVLAQAEDVIRISEILRDGRVFLGNVVQSEAGRTYGYCDDISFDCVTFVLKKIHARRTFFGLFTLEERTFSYDRILRVLPEMILVDDDTSGREPLMATTPEAAAG